MIFRILRNIASLLTGQVVVKLISLGGAIFLARRLGVEGFGFYGTVMAYLTLFASFADAGISTVTIRDISQKYTRSTDYFMHGVILRMGLTGASYSLLVVLSLIPGSGQYPLLFVLGAGLWLFPEAIRKSGVALVTAYERMGIVAGMDVLTICLRYLPFVLALLLGLSLPAAFLLLTVMWILLALIWLHISKTCGLSRPWPSLSNQTLKTIFYEALPFGAVFILSVIYFKMDILMLSEMQGRMAVGWYEGAYNFIAAALFIPLSIVNALLPVMSRSFVQDKGAYNAVYLHATRLLALGVLPVILVVTFFSRPLILLVYTADYLPSARALSVLIWALFFHFVNAPAGNVIATSRMMHKFLPYAFGNTLLNVFLNLLLIPKYSFLGAAWATTITEAVGFVIQFYFARRILGDISPVFQAVGKILGSGLCAALIFYGLGDRIMFPFNIGLLLGIYLLGVALFKVILPQDTYFCREALQLLRRQLGLMNKRDNSC